MIDEAALASTRFEPVAIELRYRPPRAGIDPEGLASSAMVSAGWPPISLSRARRAGSMSKPLTAMPAFSSRWA